jgi:hypothetical protein
MTRALLSMTMVLAGAHAIAGELVNQPVMSKRQSIKECMLKHMAASKSISYLDAAKACADRIKAQSEGLPQVNSIKQ